MVIVSFSFLFQLVPGQNVYGILRARRSARSEAVVMSVPLRAKSSDLPQTHGGIVAMLGLARFFSSKCQGLFI